MPGKKPLTDAIAVVAGATRGAGRAIAVALGEQGATVYCTGRSVRGNPSPMKRPETIDETAEFVHAAGGRGIAVRVDHTEEDQVAALFDRVKKEAGRLDVLVNDVWGGETMVVWGKPFWETDLDRGFALIRQAVFSHLITAKHGAPLMIERRRGLIVEVTDGDTLTYRGSAIYDLVKTTVIRLAYIFSEELRPHRVAAVAVTPGFLRSEEMLDHFGVTEANWREAGKKDKYFLGSETPLLVGRGIAALAADPKVFQRTGAVLSSWQLMHEYGVEDADGQRPDWGTFFRDIRPADHASKVAMERSLKWQRQLMETAASYLKPRTKADARKTRRRATLRRRG